MVLIGIPRRCASRNDKFAVIPNMAKRSFAYVRNPSGDD